MEKDSIPRKREMGKLKWCLVLVVADNGNAKYGKNK
jgi:hypothetical protein